MNEPRCVNCPSTAINNWVAAQVDYIKERDRWVGGQGGG